MAEPIVDASPYLRGGGPRRKRVVTDADGKTRTITERVPPYVGDYHKNRRDVLNLDEFGHDIYMVLTTAASDIDTDGKYARQKTRRWRLRGIYPYGQCPVAMLMQPKHGFRRAAFLNPAITADGEMPCRPGTYDDGNPCKHTREEQRLRREADGKVDRDRLAAHASEASKQGEEIGKAIVSATEKLITAAATAKADPEAKKK